MGYLNGFAVTLRQLFKPRVTTDYRGGRAKPSQPDAKRPKPERLHGRHVLNRYPDGMEKCIGCELCAGVCPAHCIYVRGADNDPAQPTAPGERYGYVYEINYLRCIHCDLCVEACPTQAITESKLFEFSFTNRDDAVYTKAELLVDDEGRPRKLDWEDWRDGDDENTSGWMRATSPSGDRRYVGALAWSGELGYGVRPPEPPDEPPAAGGGERRADEGEGPPADEPPPDDESRAAGGGERRADEPGPDGRELPDDEGGGPPADEPSPDTKALAVNSDDEGGG